MDPTTPREWQEAVDAAQGALALESARLYGFVTGGPNVDTARCEEILRAGSDLGVIPASDAIHRFVSEHMQAAGS